MHRLDDPEERARLRDETAAYRVPRFDLFPAAEVMGVAEGTPVRLSLVGRQMVVEPEDDSLPEASFRRSFSTVLRRYGPAFKALADSDRGTTDRPLSARGSRRRARPRPR